jgi:hypothetical protein
MPIAADNAFLSLAPTNDIIRTIFLAAGPLPFWSFAAPAESTPPVI